MGCFALLFPCLQPRQGAAAASEPKDPTVTEHVQHRNSQEHSLEESEKASQRGTQQQIEYVDPSPGQPQLQQKPENTVSAPAIKDGESAEENEDKPGGFEIEFSEIGPLDLSPKHESTPDSVADKPQPALKDDPQPIGQNEPADTGASRLTAENNTILDTKHESSETETGKGTDTEPKLELLEKKDSVMENTAEDKLAEDIKPSDPPQATEVPALAPPQPSRKESNRKSILRVFSKRISSIPSVKMAQEPPTATASSTTSPITSTASPITKQMSTASTASPTTPTSPNDLGPRLTGREWKDTDNDSLFCY